MGYLLLTFLPFPLGLVYQQDTAIIVFVCQGDADQGFVVIDYTIICRCQHIAAQVNIAQRLKRAVDYRIAVQLQNPVCGYGYVF
jgi:hypothetical protein